MRPSGGARVLGSGQVRVRLRRGRAGRAPMRAVGGGGSRQGTLAPTDMGGRAKGLARPRQVRPRKSLMEPLALADAGRSGRGNQVSPAGRALVWFAAAGRRMVLCCADRQTGEAAGGEASIRFVPSAPSSGLFGPARVRAVLPTCLGARTANGHGRARRGANTGHGGHPCWLMGLSLESPRLPCRGAAMAEGAAGPAVMHYRVGLTSLGGPGHGGARLAKP
jgi:hypothetical protein